MSFDVVRAKKMAPLGVAISLTTVAICIWIFVGDALPSIADILHRAPVVRIRSVSFLMPAGALMFLAIGAVAVARFLYAHHAAHSLEMVTLWISLPTVFLIPVFSIGGSFLQRHYMPQLGYHYCDQLSGNPTVWFNDWVRDPAWCVYKKDHAWVREQAAARDAAKSK
jgi:hypothetical protein